MCNHPTMLARRAACFPTILLITLVVACNEDRRAALDDDCGAEECAEDTGPDTGLDSHADIQDTRIDPDLGAGADTCLGCELADFGEVAPGDTQLDVDTTPGNCPVAVAKCSVRGAGDPPSTSLTAAPLDTLTCIAAGSSSPNGALERYEWEVVERPEGSVTRMDSANVPETDFFVDLPGRYRLRLHVTDDAGIRSCAPAEVVVMSRPDDDLHIELTWKTPNDANPLDSGFGGAADLDLHLLHPNGCWEDRRWDCHFRSISPDWGDVGRDDDNPTSHIDVTGPSGPERVEFNSPEVGRVYRVGVHYFNDHGFGSSVATVRVYVFGELVFDETRTLEGTGQMWEVATVAWPSAAVTSLGMVHDRMSDAVASCELRQVAR